METRRKLFAFPWSTKTIDRVYQRSDMTTHRERAIGSGPEVPCPAADLGWARDVTPTSAAPYWEHRAQLCRCRLATRAQRSFDVRRSASDHRSSIRNTPLSRVPHGSTRSAAIGSRSRSPAAAETSAGCFQRTYGGCCLTAC